VIEGKGPDHRPISDSDSPITAQKQTMMERKGPDHRPISDSDSPITVQKQTVIGGTDPDHCPISDSDSPITVQKQTVIEGTDPDHCPISDTQRIPEEESSSSDNNGGNDLDHCPISEKNREELKNIFERIDRNLVFDELFYDKALNFLRINSLGKDYLCWCYTFTVETKTVKDVRSYYHAILTKPEILKLYQNDKASREIETDIRCPACGKKYNMQEKNHCPECGLPYEDRKIEEKINFYRVFHTMPEGIEEYKKEVERISKIPNIQEKIIAYDEVSKKYGLS
jgi:ribosomal protein L37E